jgi:hypothetical protein
MKTTFLKLCFVLSLFLYVNNVFAWEGMSMPRLHVEGRYLKDPHGNIVNLHGFAQTYSPWFNEMGNYWSGYDVAGCLNYNKGIIDGVMAAGWKASFLRLHMDPHWSYTPGLPVEGEHDISTFDFERFKTALDSVFIPMAEYAISKGLYVIMRPPGVCPGQIAVGDAYNQYLIKVWGYVAQHPKLKNNPNIMFELANEPVNILGPDGTYGTGSQGHFDNLKTFFQAVVDTIRASADNILWIPGLGYQSLYQGYAINPIEGENIGYAVHVYPGWFNSGQGYERFQEGWDEQVKPVADFAPIVVTEMDWAPEKYNASWGKSTTGTAGGDGFGANFKAITDTSGNVSWLIFTGPDLLDDFTGIPPAAGEDYTFLNDPEACPWPTYHWYQDYALENYPRQDFEYLPQSDNGDGTFANPVIGGDFPSPIVVLADDTYYMVSASPGTSPDTTVLESKDLVNWKYSDEPIDNIPLENRILVDGSDVDSGTVIQTNTGEWWAVVSYDNGPFGKFPYLLPVTWEKDGPVVLKTAIDSTNLKKPDVGRDYYTTSLVTNDIFRHYILGPQWGWNSSPDSSKWSLLERAGYIRLRTVDVVDSLHEAKNILTQRILAYPADLDHSYGTIKMEIDSMREGDVAGLTVFQDPYGFIGVKMISGEKKLVTFINKEMQTGPTISDSIIYLQAVASFNTSKAGFYYSLDNNVFTKLGNDMTMGYNNSASTGNRFGVFNYATANTGGFVDVDWFSTESSFVEDNFYDTVFAGYTKESLTLTDVIVEGEENLTVLTSSSKSLTVKAIYADGHTEDISIGAGYTNHNPDVIAVSRGKIISLKDGNATLAIDYTGPLGEQKQVTLHVTSTTFPLTNELFNPDIFGDGSFDETTHTLHTGQWGFSGWQYGGINLSGYKYLVARLGSDNNADVEFKFFDGNSYWGPSTISKFGDGREVVVSLKYVKKSDSTSLDPSHIYIAGFWSNGSNPFIIDTVFLSNSSEYDTPVIFVNDLAESDLLKLSGFNYMEGGGPSTNQSFTVSGDMLANDIEIISPTGFEVSLNSTNGYAPSLTLVQNNGLVSEINIYVRMASGLTSDSYAGNLEVASTGLLTRMISLSGTVDQFTRIDGITDPGATVLSTEYYTLSGQKIHDLDNQRGIIIVRKFLSDGTISTTKIFKIK